MWTDRQKRFGSSTFDKAHEANFRNFHCTWLPRVKRMDNPKRERIQKILRAKRTVMERFKKPGCLNFAIEHVSVWKNMKKRKEHVFYCWVITWKWSQFFDKLLKTFIMLRRGLIWIFRLLFWEPVNGDWEFGFESWRGRQFVYKS